MTQAEQERPGESRLQKVRCVLLFALAVAAAAQPLAYKVLDEDALREHLKLASPNNAERYSRLKDLLATSGCTGDLYREQPVKGSKQPNVICDITGNGESPKRIVVGAHFDSVGGDGVIDNWSGAVMLPALSELLRSRPRRHSFEFVGFAGEEQGLLGSSTYMKSLSKEARSEIAATIIMDSLGLTPTKCWVTGSTPELVNAAAKLAQALKLDFRGANVERIGTTDSEVFQKAHIPVLSLHSVTSATVAVINGSRDVWEAVSWKDYYDSHRLIAALLVVLDQILP